MPSAVSSVPKCKANIAGSYETPGGKGPCLVPMPGPRIPQAKHVFVLVSVSGVTVPTMQAQCWDLTESFTSGVCPS